MKKLEEIGLIPLSKKESVEHDGGTNPPIKLPDIFNDGTIWCCVDIPLWRDQIRVSHCNNKREHMKNRQSSLLCVLKIYFHNRIFYISHIN